MILNALAIFFIWMIYRELTSDSDKFDGFAVGYIIVLASLAVVCVRPSYKTWRLEVFLSEKASEISGREDVKVGCNTLFDSIFNGRGIDSGTGTAHIEAGEIYFENGWCKSFMKYLDAPEGAADEEVFSMNLFTHEVMHIKGERHELKTECQAIQRNHVVGVVLGVDPWVAKENALRYYKDIYPRVNYFSSECKPEGAFDEKLDGAIWLK